MMASCCPLVPSICLLSESCWRALGTNYWDDIGMEIRVRYLFRIHVHVDMLMLDINFNLYMTTCACWPWTSSC
jgi:hypothetical protein